MGTIYFATREIVPVREGQRRWGFGGSITRELGARLSTERASSPAASLDGARAAAARIAAEISTDRRLPRIPEGDRPGGYRLPESARGIEFISYSTRGDPMCCLVCETLPDR